MTEEKQDSDTSEKWKLKVEEIKVEQPGEK